MIIKFETWDSSRVLITPRLECLNAGTFYQVQVPSLFAGCQQRAEVARKTVNDWLIERGAKE